MKLSTAIKKLSKLTTVKNNHQTYSAKVNDSIIEFMRNGKVEEDPNITCIRVRDITDHDDSMTDYSAGIWCNNLTQAIKLAQC